MARRAFVAGQSSLYRREVGRDVDSSFEQDNFAALSEDFADHSRRFDAGEALV